MSQPDLIVIGAGAAGLLAAARAAELGNSTLLLEKNTKPGVKILMSGGTRCNLTHQGDKRGIIDAFGEQGSFLHSPLAALPPEDLVALVEAEGVATKVEPTGKIFPASDRAVDVLNGLLRRVRRSEVALSLAEGVEALEPTAGGWQVQTNHRTLHSRHVIVTTGGQSYPGCGTTGDAYQWMRELGHTIVAPVPALVPVTIRADWAKTLRGITLDPVRVAVRSSGHPEAEIAATTGSMLFAHFGLSGPAVLDISRWIARHPQPRSLILSCDFLPNETAEAIADRFTRWAQESGRKRISNLMCLLLPKRLIDALLELGQMDPERRAAELSKVERKKIVRLLKDTEIPVTGTVGFKKAEVTAGGVALDEVDSRTMQSKRHAGLYIAGELLDLDGPIGGFNFQAAFSTGWLAGESAATR